MSPYKYLIHLHNLLTKKQVRSIKGGGCNTTS
jgi:hypothetical protein